ncbi:hypothetical protein SAMN04488065_2071 [Haloplanus vescus]|uniref:DUF7305 domain-containing protein n=1 Tax=Haloplanus vescus TaxID=555874 RepID=A0A1H3Z229_9EURY|nr:hypothetical protein SAMN04488065_2071 [Haloplanus vescus]
MPTDPHAGGGVSDRATRRGQSTVIGVVLILGLVVVGTTGVLLLGSEAIQGVRDEAGASQAEVAMSTVDSQVSEVALGYANTRQVELGGQRQATLDESAGRITISRAGANATGPPLVNTTMGAIEYRAGGSTVAYQGGGVWRTSGAGQARMISPPEFHYRWGTGASGEPTLTFPLVVLRGPATSSDQLRFVDGPTNAAFPNASAGMQNPLDAGTVEVSIQSEYYRAWAEYFETRTDADTVRTDDANQTVEIVLSVPTRGREVQESIASEAPTVTVQNGATVDSYNSSEGTYPATKGENGSVYVGENLTNSGGGRIEGDMRVDGDFGGGGGIEVTGQLVVDGDADLSGGGITVNDRVIADGDLVLGGGGALNGPATVSGDVIEGAGGITVDDDVTAGGDYRSEPGGSVNGDVHLGGNFYPADGQNIRGDLTVAGTFENGPDVYPNIHPSATIQENGPEPDLSDVSAASDLRPPNLRPIDTTVQTRVSTTAASNDNDGSDVSKIEGGSCPCTLTNGSYSLDSFEPEGDVTLDTTGGPIYLAINGDVLTDSENIEVIGPNEVHVYATGDYTISGGSRWDSVDDRGDQIWLYGTSDSAVTIANGARFYGVVYAPGNEDIRVESGARVYGGLVGGVSAVESGSRVSYDTVLADQTPELTGGGGAPVTYLHVSVNEIRVEEA